jgi:hypothetical protein
MFQRIQTLFMFFALVASVLVFFFPLVSYLSDFYYYKLYICHLKAMTPDADKLFGSFFTVPLIIINLLVIGLIGTAIFLYKNRLRQVQMLKMAFFLEIILIALIFFYNAPAIQHKIQVSPDYTGEVGIYLPLITLIFIFLANRFIIKDEKMVKSADRIR